MWCHSKKNCAEQRESLSAGNCVCTCVCVCLCVCVHSSASSECIKHFCHFLHIISSFIISQPSPVQFSMSNRWIGESAGVCVCVCVCVTIQTGAVWAEHLHIHTRMRAAHRNYYLDGGVGLPVLLAGGSGQTTVRWTLTAVPEPEATLGDTDKHGHTHTGMSRTREQQEPDIRNELMAEHQSAEKCHTCRWWCHYWCCHVCLVISILSVCRLTTQLLLPDYN